MEAVLQEYNVDSFRKVFELFNDMERDGTIEKYALGGAAAANFYIEPVYSLDMDFFVSLSTPSLDFLKEIDNYIKTKGYTISEKGYYVIEGNLVQILSSDSSKVAMEAVNERVYNSDVGGFVFTPEYVLVDALLYSSETKRDKYGLRVQTFLDRYKKLDKEKVAELLSKFNLLDKFKRIFGERL